MRRLFLVLLLILGTVVPATAQAPTFVPVVLPDMIEISFDGVTYQAAGSYVSGIVISTGQAALNHIFHARRGSIIHFEAQLGGSFALEKAEWFFDTVLLPAGENKFYLRFSYGFEEPAGSGVYITSPVSDASEVVKLIGKPGKPRRDG